MAESTAKRVKVPGGYRFTHHTLDVPNWIFAPVGWVTEDLQTIARRRYKSPLSEKELRGSIALGARGGHVPLLKFTGKDANGTLEYRPGVITPYFLREEELRSDQWHVPAGVRAQVLSDFECLCVGIEDLPVVREVWDFLPPNHFVMQPIKILHLQESVQKMLEEAGITTVDALCRMTEDEVSLIVGAHYSEIKSALSKFGLSFRDADELGSDPDSIYALKLPLRIRNTLLAYGIRTVAALCEETGKYLREVTHLSAQDLEITQSRLAMIDKKLKE